MHSRGSLLLRPERITARRPVVYYYSAAYTLYVTTTAGRVKNLLSLVESENRRLFWFATLDEIRQMGVLAPIWRMPFSDQPGTLL